MTRTRSHNRMGYLSNEVVQFSTELDASWPSADYNHMVEPFSFFQRALRGDSHLEIG